MIIWKAMKFLILLLVKQLLDNESDKNRAKKIMQKAKIKTADFFITTPGEY